MSNEIYEGLIEIKSYYSQGTLPDLFRFDDGRRVSTADEWNERRAEIYKTAIELQYGTIPPAPDSFKVEPLYICGTGLPSGYRITCYRGEKSISFTMYLFKAENSEGAPVTVSGDLCFPYVFDKEYVSTFINNGISLAIFNRTELAPDIAGYNISGLDKDGNEYIEGKKVLDRVTEIDCGGPLKELYPEYTFGALGAWAWGYSRCVDALIYLGNVDANTIAFTGHSRGGKVAALAGVLDERAAIVNPNASCSGGYGSYRIHIEATKEDGSVAKSEPLKNIHINFPSWLGKEMREYIGREDELPFDSHHLKAMVAPRVLFVSEAASDIMANPVGTWQTSLAAGEVYKFLGCEENLIWYFRRGVHRHAIEDIEQLCNVIRHVKYGEALNDKYFKLPFTPTDLSFDWRAPKK